MKRILKVSLIISLFFCILLGFFQTISNADHSSEVMAFIKEDHKDNTGAAANVSTMSSILITSVRITGISVAVVILLVLAMKYMIAAPGEKADIKKSAVPYVIGALVLFGAVGILEIINKFSTAVKA